MAGLATAFSSVSNYQGLYMSTYRLTGGVTLTVLHFLCIELPPYYEDNNYE